MRNILKKYCALGILLLCFNTVVFAQSRWDKENSGTSKDLSFVTVINDKIFVVGDSGSILTSTDSWNWSMQTTGTSNLLTGIAGNADKLVAVGENGTILTSVNGTDWEQHLSGTKRHLYSIAWNSEKFVTVGDSGTILISPDGDSWTNQSTDTKYVLKSVTYNNTTLVAAGSTNTNSNPHAVILTSDDGIKWTIRNVNDYAPLNCILWNGSKFYTVGNNGTILNSIDGVKWTGCNVGSQELTSITTYYDRCLLAFGENTLFRSWYDDSWYKIQPYSLPQTILQSLAWFDPHYRFIAVGVNGMIYTAPEDDTSVLITINEASQSNEIDLCISNKILKASIPENMTEDGVSIEIYSLTGKKIMELSQLNRDAGYTFPLTDLAPGVYQLAVSNNRKRLTRQFVYAQ